MEKEEQNLKRCVVRFGENFCNIEADQIWREESIVIVYRGKEIVGIFDLGFVDAIWLTEKGGNNNG